MRALRVSLDFVCCQCGGPVGVTLECDGPGLMSDNPVMSARVPCPGCPEINTIVFATDGTLHAVLPERARCRVPESCAN